MRAFHKKIRLKISDQSSKRKRLKMNKLSFSKITYITFSINKDCKMLNLKFSLIAAPFVLGKKHNLF